MACASGSWSGRGGAQWSEPRCQQAEVIRFNERTAKVVRDGGFRGPVEMSDPVMVQVNKTAQSRRVTEKGSEVWLASEDG